MYTAEQVASMLDVHEQTVRRWCKAGLLKGKYKLNNRRLGWRIKEVDLVEYLRAHGEEERAMQLLHSQNRSFVLES